MNKFWKIILLFTIFCVQNVSGMTWELVNNSGHRFVVAFSPEKVASETRVNLDIFCKADSLKTLSDKEQKLFQKSDNTTELQRTFQKYGYEFVYSLFEHVDDEDESEELNLVFDAQRLVCKGTPIKIRCDELNEIIKTRKVIFYTGAGISAAAIPTMNVLLSSLKYRKS